MHSSCCVDPFATFIVARRRLEERESQLSSESVRMTFRRAPAPEVLLRCFGAIITPRGAIHCVTLTIPAALLIRSASRL
jgi:hypothetical protein